MTSEGPHHPGQEPDEVSPGAGGSPPYGDRSAQQSNGYGTAAPDLGWAPPPPAARPSSPAPAWGAPGEAPPTVGWKAPDSPPPGPWGPPGGQAQAGPWGGPGEQAQPATWNPQADQQQPTTAWAAASVPQQPAWGQQENSAPQAGQQPSWGQQGDSAPQAGQQPPWGQGGAPQQTWPARDDEQQPGRGPQQPAPWSPPAEQPRTAAWSPPETPEWGNPPEQDDQQQPGGWTPPAGQQQPPAWGPQGDQQPPAWGGQGGQQQPAAWGAAPVPQAADPEPGAWGAAPVPQAGGGQEQNNWGSAAVPQPGAGPDQHGSWGPANEPPPTAAWAAASVPQQAEQPQSHWDAPAEQSRPTEAWPPAEPAAAPPARATASVGRVDPAAWGAGTARPGDDGLPARPAVPEGEPWSADEAWGRSAQDQAPAEPAGPAWEQPRAENSPIYQPAPGPGISPANAVPLPPTEARVPGASLAAAPLADYAPAGRDSGGQSGYDPDQPGDGWGGDAPQGARQSGAAPVIPQPRTSPEAQPGEPGGSISASASVPLSSRVMPPTDQALRPDALPAPQPRVYGRPVRAEDGPEQDGQAGHQPEPHRFQPDGEPGGRFGGGPETRFGDAPGGHFGDAPGGRFGDGPGGRFDDGPAGRFDGGPGTRFDERDQPHDRPGAFGDGPAMASASAPPVPAGALPAFPPSMPPAFADPSNSQRPVNGTKPHSEPVRPDDRFSGAAAPVSGGGAGHGPLPGHGPGDAPGGAFPPAFPPAGDQPERPLWDLGDTPGADQSRFDSFKPEPQAKPAEQPAPKVRNGRVLMAVLTAAVLILVVPLGLLWLLGKTGGSDAPPAFNPAVGSCVKQSGGGAVAAGCGDQGAFKVVSKVDAKDKCADPGQPHVVLPGTAPDRVLCLAPATAG